MGMGSRRKNSEAAPQHHTVGQLLDGRRGCCTWRVEPWAGVSGLEDGCGGAGWLLTPAARPSADGGRHDSRPQPAGQVNQVNQGPGQAPAG